MQYQRTRNVVAVTFLSLAAATQAQAAAKNGCAAGMRPMAPSRTAVRRKPLADRLDPLRRA